jgi:hypothetical protein
VGREQRRGGNFVGTQRVVEFHNLTSTVSNGSKTGALSEPSIRCVRGCLLPEPLHANEIRAAPPAGFLVVAPCHEESAAPRAGSKAAQVGSTQFGEEILISIAHP